jgi:periplasmic protein CpxP/Spy
MIMIRNALIAALALAGALSWPSQALGAQKDKPAQGQRPARFRERMQNAVKELELSDEQKARLKPLWQEQAQKLRQLRQDKSLSAQEKKAQLKDLQKDFEPKLKEVLTDQQFEKWQKQQEEARQRGRPRQK